ncbi:O-antigen polymerase, partial [Salmonella enterica]|nr:O-antigen polymerase [Salmonella enterica]
IFNHDPWFIVMKKFPNNIFFLLVVLMIIAIQARIEKRRAIQ